MTTTDEVANIAAEAVEVFRLRAGQELLRLCGRSGEHVFALFCCWTWTENGGLCF